MIRFTKEAISDFVRTWTLVIPYEICIQIFVSLGLLPIVSFGMKRVLLYSGREAAGNLDIFLSFQNIPGILFLILAIFLLGYLILLEIGGILFIETANLKNEQVTLVDVVRNAHGFWRKLFSPGIILLLLYFFLLLPFAEVGMSTSMLQEITIPQFLLNGISNEILREGIMIFLGLGIFLLSMRWIFVMHYIILGDYKITEAFRKSRELVKKNRKKVFVYFLCSSFLITVLALVLYFLILFVPMVFGVFAKTEWGSYFAFSLSASFSNFVLAILLHIIQIPMSLFLLTKLFFRLEGECKLEQFKIQHSRRKTPFGNWGFRNRKKISIILFLFLVGMIALFSWGIIYVEETFRHTTVTAHRGASSYAPENTMAAIEKAIQLGADVTEIDVQRIKDGTVVLFHDSDLKRTAGKNQKIWDLTREDLKEVDVGSWFSSEYKSQQIPTLEEVLQYAKGKIFLNIELKPHGDESDLIKEVVRLIQKNHMEDEVILTSLQYDILTLSKEMDSHIKIGYVFFSTIGDIYSYKVDVYSIEAQFLSESLVEEIHQNGKEVHVWTVNDEEEATKFALYQVDSIITDAVEAVKEAVNQVEQMTVQERFLQLMYLVE